MTDEEICEEEAQIAEAQRDARGFGKLYEKYFDRIYYYILRQTDDEALAGDLCSQVFLNALQHLPRFELRGVPFSAWLYRIASNEVNKHYRKTKSQPVFCLEDVRVRELVAQSPYEADDELIERMIGYLTHLPTDMLRVLELRFFEGKDFREIAFILNMTESGAKMRTYRALDQLRKKFNLKAKYNE
jgi:RNA polymerase sigma-70 factor (ECF subfamily)